MSALLCPKCHNVMNAYERNGVTVDQCVECKGLFLDRGELERLAAAETAYYGQPPTGDDMRETVPARTSDRAPARHHDDDRHREDRYREDRDRDDRYREDRYRDDRYRDDRYRDDRQYHKKKKRKAFLEELLDF